MCALESRLSGPPIPSSPELFLCLLGGPRACEWRRHLQILDGAGDVVQVDGVDDDGRRGEEEEEEEEESVDCGKAGPPVAAADGQVLPGRDGGARRA